MHILFNYTELIILYSGYSIKRNKATYGGRHSQGLPREVDVCGDEHLQNCRVSKITHTYPQ